ncbi:hypothetical protein [Taibaiella soli]|uniref:DUF4142 domain-containing protein n=1 Tax=Taibaiella soli TaxID=1649169 RepID=A0A2W2B3Q9_9BACT|nr:hypothetical protein [Taibaiella soli]PZF70859.1 hypothetical protein DN068_20750 [Taibaiella soli]
MILKNIRRIAVVLLCCFALLSAPHAKAQQAVNELAQAMTDDLGYLNLTADQTANALGMNKMAASSLVQLGVKAQNDTTFRGPALFKQILFVMKTRNDALKKMLTPDQLKSWQEHRTEQLADLQTEMMIAQLDLTNEQIPKVYDVNLKFAGELMGNVDKMQSSKNKMQKSKVSKEMKSDSKAKDEAMKPILSADQYDVYMANREAMRQYLKETMKKK